ncbi:MAG: thiolase family protein [Acidobacteriota bacterium]|nr:MAG: thiolase family protein [Acidobacteriota bacterium]
MSQGAAAVVAGVRTPFVKAWTALDGVAARELARLVIREIVDRADLSPKEVDEVILGCVSQPAEAVNVARVAALEAGIPRSVPAYTVARNCASGLQALTSACEKIQTGQASCLIAGGVESMSNVPLQFSKAAQRKFMALGRAKIFSQKFAAVFSFRPKDLLSPVEALRCCLTDPVSGLGMGETAELLAKELKISREEQDAFALESHRRAARAWDEGRFRDEVMTLYPAPSHDAVSFDTGIRRDQTPEALAKLEPVFDRKFGTVTAGNSSQVSDGAAALLVMREDKARALGYRPLGFVRAYAYAGCDPARMGLGPVFVVQKLLKQTGVRLADVELVELNEAFAAQAIACERVSSSASLAKRYGLDGAPGELNRERLNPKGGAIALGHPVGASGARLVLTLALEMKRRRRALGLAALCVGGGQGGALLLERK